ncbi:MAG TPA: DUF3866 family protein [Solirubrobacterales bacterium]
MLKLRRGVVVEADPLTVELGGGERRRAWSDPGLIGACEPGDEVLVNVEALDLNLGSGGFDIVCANLTRGLGAERAGEIHVMKLNYSPLQHPVDPVEAGHDEAPPRPGRTPPVLVVPLHGHLAPVAWAFAEVAAGLGLGYVQTPGAALPGTLSRDVASLRDRGLLAGHVTAGPCYGGEYEAISVPGALHAAAERLGWDAIVAGPGPGILGSATRYGHGGMAALDSAHAALALGLPTLLSPRLSASDPRDRHRGLSHHSAAVLELLLAPVRVPVPETDAGGWPTGAPEGGSALDALAAVTEACGGRHDVAVEPIDLDGYAAAGLPTRSMGRAIDEDPLFFAAPLAAGRALAHAVRESG